MKKESSHTIVALLYLAVACGTALGEEFRFLSWPALLFCSGLAASAALSFMIQSRGTPPSCAQSIGYIGAQLALFLLLHQVPVPHGLFWLLAMPVISHATYFLHWPGALLSSAVYMALVVWLDHGRDLTCALVVRASLQYGAACLFTAIFTHSTRQAVRAQEEASRLAEELEQANARLQAGAAREKLNAALSERNRIARDIHDGLGHCLTTIAVQLEVARSLVREDSTRAAEAIAKAEHQSRAALDEVRRSVRTLRDDAPPPELRDALAGLVKESGLEAAFRVEGTPRPLPAPAAQALFRTAQEGLTNVRKHSGTRQASILLRYLPGTTAIEITDAGRCAGAGTGRCAEVGANADLGKGANARASAGASAEAGAGSFGLAGLRERLESLGGGLVAGPRPEGGYRLCAEVPL